MRREISFAQAINEALHQACRLSPNVMVLGQLVDYRSGIFGTTTGLVEEFGPERIQDFPVAEAAMTSAALGTALAGARPVLVHQRLDFMMYSLDAIANWLALWRFKSNGKGGVPVTIRAIVGRGWGQGPQHSKSLHSWFAHVPGLRVAVPSTAYDAKGLLLESIFGEDPCLIIEHRGLFSMVDHVPDVPYRVRFGQAVVRRTGRDLTIATIGAMTAPALRAAEQLAAQGISAEVIDLRTVRPLDIAAIVRSVRQTGRLVVADPAWRTGSVAAEIISSVCEELGGQLRANPKRVCFPDSHTPMSAPLEQAYYPDEKTIAEAVTAMVLRPSIQAA
jgi:acetoin:2,6-dichlorophenolindophenol oxidoreductase subunit beta